MNIYYGTGNAVKRQNLHSSTWNV